MGLTVSTFHSASVAAMLPSRLNPLAYVRLWRLSPALFLQNYRSFLFSRVCGLSGRDLVVLLLLTPPGGRSLDESIFTQQLCVTLLALSRDRSPFNAYYASHLCDHVQRVLMQFLRSLAQEDSLTVSSPVLGSLLLVVYNHRRFLAGDGHQSWFGSQCCVRSTVDATEVDRNLRRLREKTTSGVVESMRALLVGEKETLEETDALSRYFAREFQAEKGESMRLSRVLKRIESGGGWRGRVVDYSQKDAAAIAEDVFDYVIGNGVDDECADLPVEELLAKMTDLSTSQRAFLLFALQYITAISPDAWNLFVVSLRYGAESWKKEGEKCRCCLDLLNALLSITVDRKDVSTLEELKNLICTL